MLALQTVDLHKTFSGTSGADAVTRVLTFVSRESTKVKIYEKKKKKRISGVKLKYGAPLKYRSIGIHPGSLIYTSHSQRRYKWTLRLTACYDVPLDFPRDQTCRRRLSLFCSVSYLPSGSTALGTVWYIWERGNWELDIAISLSHRDRWIYIF